MENIHNNEYHYEVKYPANLNVEMPVEAGRSIPAPSDAYVATINTDDGFIDLRSEQGYNIKKPLTVQSIINAEYCGNQDPCPSKITQEDFESYEPTTVDGVPAFRRTLIDDSQSTYYVEKPPRGPMVIVVSNTPLTKQIFSTFKFID